MSEGKKHVSSASGKHKRNRGEPTEHPPQETEPLNTKQHSLVRKMKACSSAIRRSRKKQHSVQQRKSSNAAAFPRCSQRAVHFDKATVAPETTDAFAPERAFRRSSRCRQPVPRAKGSPPPALLARIQGLSHAQSSFDPASDGESGLESEDPLFPPPRCLQRNEHRTVALDTRLPCAGDEDEEHQSSEDSEEDTFTILPAITINHVEDDEEVVKEEGERVGDVAEGSVNRRSSAWKNSVCRRQSLRRFSVRGASVRRVSVRKASVYRAAIARGSVRRGSVRQLSTNVHGLSVRRMSVASRPGTSRRLSTVAARPQSGYVARRRSIRQPCESYTALRGRKKCRKPRHRPYRRPRKIVVIGDMCSGKTGLISAYCKDRFSETYAPTILNTCMTDADVLGGKIELVVVEVPGRKDLAKLRPCAYHKMDVVLLCYSADRPSSLEALKTEWLPELKKYAPMVPYILVATKTDVREEHFYQQQQQLAANSTENEHCAEDILSDMVTSSEGRKAAELMEAHSFLECSAMYRDGTRDVFETAARVALRNSPRRRKKRNPHCAKNRNAQSVETCTIL